VTTQVAP